MATVKQKLYKLFLQGYDINSPEAKRIVRRYDTRWKYHNNWGNDGMLGYVGHEAEEAYPPV